MGLDLLSKHRKFCETFEFIPKHEISDQFIQKFLSSLISLTLIGGYYHGVLLFPPEYPMKPPGIMMITPNGRFSCNTR
jgi:ubiquitin-protein ligase